MDKTCSRKGCLRPVNIVKHGLCHACYNRARYHGELQVKSIARTPLAVRLWANVDVGNARECWNFTGKSDTKGYGSIYDGITRKKILAHRAAWVVSNGPIPAETGSHGTVVRHKCDNRRCCNPTHLELGTQADNVHDMDKRGRRVVKTRVGERHHATKISAEQVREIRAADDHKLDQFFAEKFGMSRSGIKQIRLKRFWKHIT